MCLVSLLPVLVRVALVCLMLCWQTACKVGPNFSAPAAPDVKGYTQTPLSAKTVPISSLQPEVQSFLTGRDIPLMWWELFHSEDLNQLVSAGLANNPTLAGASAALRQAQEAVNVQFGNALLPAFDASGFAQRQRFSEQQIGISIPISPTFNLFYASVNVAYTLDIFGGARRQLESLLAQVDYQQFQLIAAYLTISSNIVTTSITIASYSAQIDATLALIKSQEGVLTTLTQQYRLGGASKADMLAQKTLLEQSKASLAVLEKQLSQVQHALSALIGTSPDKPLPVLKLNHLTLPKDLPVSLPSKLVRQRPDVRASEALLHSASAQIGVATSNLFPQFTLNGSFGYINDTLTNLFTSPNNVWSIMAPIAQPLFHGGALLAQRRASIDAYQQAMAQYRQIVLQAFKQVADVLRALETDAASLQAQLAAEQAAQGSLTLIMGQYRLGATTYVNVLTAQQQYQKTRLMRIQAQATRYNDTAALFQALGGGWWHKPWCVKE